MNKAFYKICFTFGLCLVALSASSQQSSLRINHFFEETPLLEVLEWIEQQHKVKIAYSKDILNEIVVSGEFTDTPVDLFLSIILNNTPLTFRMLQDDQILIGPEEELSLSMPVKDVPVLISGRVIGPNDQPLEFANLLHEASQTGTFTNEEGYFEWPQTIVADSLWIEVSYLGFEKQKILVEELSSPVLVQLKPSTQFFREIEVVDLLPPPKWSSVLFSETSSFNNMSKVSFLPGGANILLDLQAIPGIAVHNEHLSARLNVRGGNTDENLIILDGMSLYNVDHFYGFFSALHPGITQDVNVYKNTFPIEYNGRSSSIVQLNGGIDQNKLRDKSTFGVDFISANAMLNLPLRENMYFRAAGRVTHQDIANTPFFQLADVNSNSSKIDLPEQAKRATTIDINPAFHFNDLYLNWHWSLDEDHTISASLFNGVDQYDYDYTQSYFLNINAGRVKISENGREKVRWKNSAYGLQFKKRWDDSFQSTLNTNFSTYRTERNEGYTITQTFREVEKIRAAPQSNKLNDIEGFRIEQKNEWQLSNSSKLSFGYSFLQEKIDFGIANSNGQESRDISKVDVANTHSFFIQHDWAPIEDINFNMGLNIQKYDLLEPLFWSPRIQIKLFPTKQLSFKGSWSIYQQFLRQLYHEDVFGKNQALWLLAGTSNILPAIRMPHIESHNLMLGTSLVAGNWYFDLEFYQKNREGIVEYTLRRPGFNQDGVITEPVFGFFLGEGKTKGMDLLLKKRGEKYNGWIAYTLSKSTHQLKGVNFNRPYPAPDDSRHQISWINQYTLDQHWMLSANYIFASGLPYLDYGQVREIPSNRRVFSYENFIQRYKAYHRMDLSVNYATHIFNLDTQFGLSIFNVFNRNNIKYRQFVFSVEEENESRVLGTELGLLPRIWNVSVEVRFF
jgi:hypothetical protein